MGHRADDLLSVVFSRPKDQNSKRRFQTGWSVEGPGGNHLEGLARPLFLGSVAGLDLNHSTDTENPLLPGDPMRNFSKKQKAAPVIMQSVYPKLGRVINNTTQGHG